MADEKQAIWRPVNYKDYGRYYEVSTRGEVRRIGSETPLRPARLKSGYLAVCLCYEGTQKTVCNHRLVALTFIPNPDPSRYNQVGHLDETRDSNCVTNLFWTNALGNNLFGTHIKRQVQTVMEKRERARRKRMGRKVPVCILRPMPDGGVSGQTFESIAEASRQTGVKKRDILAVCKGLRRTAGGYRWVFAYTDEELKPIRKDVSKVKNGSKTPWKT